MSGSPFSAELAGSSGICPDLVYSPGLLPLSRRTLEEGNPISKTPEKPEKPEKPETPVLAETSAWAYSLGLGGLPANLIYLDLV
jgi:hypothetical protein